MTKLILSMFMTLDGFVKAPNGDLIRPDWSDDMEQNWSAPNIAPDSLLLYGRRAFEENAPLWPAMEQAHRLAFVRCRAVDSRESRASR